MNITTKLSAKHLLLGLASTLLSATLSSQVAAHDMVPGSKQSQPILIQNATLHTVSDGIKSNSDLLFSNGKITAIGVDLEAPANTRIIDGQGKHLYPGLILLGSSIGLREIGAVRATVDDREVGEDNPHLLAQAAFNSDSEMIPTLRANGITHADITPKGALLAGQSAVVNLDAWTLEDALVKGRVGSHLYWPSEPGKKITGKKRKKAMEKYHQKLSRLEDFFRQARAYAQLSQQQANLPQDIRWHSMLGLLSQQQPLIVHANRKTQIEQAMRFAQRQQLKLVILGGADSWQLADQLAAAKIPVIYTHAFGLPQRGDEDIDQAFKAPMQLAQAGVPLAIGYQSAWDGRNLAFAAGMAANYGLGQQQALRAITLAPAEILGVADQLGSLEVGKSASLILSAGDILDYQGHKIEHLFIDGRLVDRNNRNLQLYNKYRQKTLP